MLKSVEPDGGTITDTARPVRRWRGIGRGALQFLLMIAVLTGSVIAMNRLIETRPEKSGRPAFRTVYAIDAQTVGLVDQRPSINVFGQVVAARSVELRSLVGGEIIAVNDAAKAGARVEKDALLVEIDPFNYQGALVEAKSNLEQTEAAISEIEARLVAEQDQKAAAEEQLELARSDLQRAASLRKSGSLTQKQLDDRALLVSQREQAVNQRVNNLRIEQARLSQQRAAAQRLAWKVTQAERNLKDTKLTAPFSGIVRSESAEIGRMVNSNDVVLSLYADRDLEARFTLTDAQYGRVATDEDPLIGRRIEAVWTVGGVDYSYAGEVVRIAAEIVSDRGGVEIFARLDESDGPVQLRPGAFLEISVPDRKYIAAARLPETALYDSSQVYLVTEGVLQSRKVQVAAYDGNEIIVTEGLANGDQVMTTRLSKVSNGLPVSVNTLAPAGDSADAPVDVLSD